MKFTKRTFGMCALTALASLAASPLYAQAYPAKPVTIVAPQAVGGAADLATRAFAIVAEKYLGESIRVVNKEGGAGVPGVMAVKEAAPDGYTLLAPMSPFVLAGPVFREASPYKTFDLDYLSILEEQPLTFAVVKDNKFADAKAFLDYARTTKEPIRVAVGAKTSLATISLNALAKDLGVGADILVAVPYKSGPDSTRGLLAGDVDVASINLSSINAALKSGDARLLMVTTPERNAAYPDAATASEMGLPTVNGITLWIGLAGPAGLPQDVKDKWEEVVRKVIEDPEYLGLLEKRGATSSGQLAAESEATIRLQLASFESLKAALSGN